MLDLWEGVPTPDREGRVRETTVARVLKQNRIRRLDAGQVLKVLRQEPVVAADGTTAAAQAHVTMLIARIRLLNQQIGDAHRRLDRLTAKLAGSQEGPGENCDPDEDPGRLSL